MTQIETIKISNMSALNAASGATLTSTLTRFPKISEINTAGITIKKNADGESRLLYYSGSPLRCQTGLVECPVGISEDGKIRFNLSDASLVKLREIDAILSNIAEEEGLDNQSICASSLSLTVGPWTRFFDNNKAPVDNNSSILSTEFTALMLIDMSKIIVFNERLMLSMTVQQVMVRAYNQLPRGCVIYGSLSDLRASGALQNQVCSSASASGDTACVSDGSAEEEINELL